MDTSAPIRIVLLTTSFPLYRGSTSGAFIARLAKHLPKQIQTTVLTPCGCDRPEVNESKYAVQCFRYAFPTWQIIAHRPGGIPTALRDNHWLYLLLPIFFVSMLFSCIRLALNADLIHANWSLNGVIAGIAGLATKTPVVTTLRGSDVTRIETSRVSMLVTHLCLRLNTNIICVSEAIHANVRKHFPQYENKLHVIPNGVDHEFLRPNRIERDHKHPFRLLFVGNLIPLKAAHLVIEALAELGNSSKTELILVGDGPEKAHLQSLAKQLSLNAKVSFIGTVAPESMIEWFAKASCLILPSFSEGRPNVILEAMASGLPVLASRIEGVTELVLDGVTGHTFKPGDVRELARYIAAFEDDPTMCRRFGEAGQRFIVERGLTWGRAAQRYSEIYSTAARTQSHASLG